MCLNTLGQDRRFTKEQIDFTLKTVEHYRATWENQEKKNLESDVLRKLKYTEEDKLYREHYSVRDDQRLEEIIEEAIATAEAQQMADGEDPLNEEEKAKITKRTTFDQLTKAFHAPDEYAQYKANLEMQA